MTKSGAPNGFFPGSFTSIGSETDASNNEEVHVVLMFATPLPRLVMMINSLELEDTPVKSFCPFSVGYRFHRCKNAFLTHNVVPLCAQIH